MGRAQLDMFAADAELFDAASPVYRADPDRVRTRLQGMLEEARSAGAHGVTPSRRRWLETVVPQMTQWLPPDEAAQVRQDFDTALRLAE